MPVLPKPLTTYAVSKLRPRERRFDVRDGALKGFFIRIHPSGSRTYFIEYPRDRRWRIGSAAEYSLKDARERAKQIKAEVQEHGQPLEVLRNDQSGTLRSFIEGPYMEWASAHQSHGKQMVTRILGALSKKVLDTPLVDLRKTHLERWQTSRLKDGIRPSTINRETAQIRSALHHAVDDPAYSITENPAVGIKAKRVDRVGVTRYLEPDERRRLMPALRARDDHLRPLTLIALNTGLRRGELFNLQWRDITLGSVNRSVTVRGEGAKSGQSRTIKLNARALIEARRWKRLSSGTDRSDYVFPGKGGKRLNNIKKGWATLLRDAAITDFRFHDCRHDFASRLVMAGIPLKAVSKLLGHSTILLTERYAHLAPDWGADAVDVL